MQIDVGILGATGMVGQQFIRLLADHPWFQAGLAGGERALGRKALRATRRRGGWRCRCPPRRRGAAGRGLRPRQRPRLVFSALDAAAAGELERAFAAAGHIVVSNARNFRMDPRVPLLIPEINADHLALLDRAAPAARMEGRHRHQPELLDRRARDGARAAAPVRAPDGAGDDDAGGLGRRLSRRAVARHPRQRHPVHRRRRGREDRERAPEDPRHARRTAACRPHPAVISAHTNRVPVHRRPHADDLGGARAAAGRPTRSPAALRDVRAAGRRSWSCRARRAARSCTRRQRTGRSRGSTPTAAAA